MLSSTGFYCESCGVCADSLCIQTAEVVLKCKENFIQSSTVEKTVNDQLHMWVKGNLTQVYVCCVCERDIDYHGRPGLYGMQIFVLLKIFIFFSSTGISQDIAVAGVSEVLM